MNERLQQTNCLNYNSVQSPFLNKIQPKIAKDSQKSTHRLSRHTAVYATLYAPHIMTKECRDI